MPGRPPFTADRRMQNRPVPSAAEVGEAAGTRRCAFAELRRRVSRCELGRGRSRGLLHLPLDVFTEHWANAPNPPAMPVSAGNLKYTLN